MAADKVTVNVNIPNAVKGANVTVPYLGTFKNGEPSTVPRAQADRFVRNQQGADRYKGMDTITIPPPKLQGTSATDDSGSSAKSEQNKSQEK